jgi:hypothetical protein
MRIHRAAMFVLFTLVCADVRADTELLPITSPGFQPSNVDINGVVHEDWGTAGLRLSLDGVEATVEQRYDESGAPTVVTQKTVGALRLTERAFRAPIWPTGADVIDAEIENSSDESVVVPLDLVLPEKAGIGDRLCRLESRVIAALPDARRAEQTPRSWGGNATAPLRDWGRPQVECDAGFRHIRAGMGGVPIQYEFAVEPGSDRTVVLGFCESHWGEPGRRPVVIDVEGAKRSILDPIEKWGQHVPGCLRFDAHDTNRDGRLDVVVSPSPGASDLNPILNVAWVFPTGASVEMAKVASGDLNAVAEYYVDAGGDADQDLYEGGKVSYSIPLAPREKRSLLFLLASPGTQVLPNPLEMAWSSDSLRKAADDVWRDRPDSE